jgi:sulfur carrier protein ThiS
MKVTLKLFASLMAHLPPERRAGHAVEVDLPERTTVLEALRAQGVPPGQCAILLLDGAWVPPGEREGRVLQEGQVLAVWPPVAGG